MVNGTRVLTFCALRIFLMCHTYSKQSDGSLDIHRSVTVAPPGGFKHFQGPLSSCNLHGLMDCVSGPISI